MEQDQKEQALKTRTTTIYVNRRPVEMHGRSATGAEIKIAADVPVDFKLYLVHGGPRDGGRDRLELVEDDQEVPLREGLRFRAVSGYDVS